jgi:hypothetical protein
MKRLLPATLALFFVGPASAAFMCYNSNGDSVTWTVGQPKPSIDLADISQFRCAANFDELSYLRDRFDGLPMKVKGGNVVIWRGYDAAFIIDNL